MSNLEAKEYTLFEEIKHLSVPFIEFTRHSAVTFDHA